MASKIAGLFAYNDVLGGCIGIILAIQGIVVIGLLHMSVGTSLLAVINPRSLS